MVPAGTHLANAVVLYNSLGRRPNSAINPHARKGRRAFGNTAARRIISP